MLAWLRNHATEVQAFAAAIQGAAAIVVAVLTYRLVKATREYVSLTTDLATAARAQLDVLEEQRTLRAMRLRTLVWQLKVRLAELPTDFRFKVEASRDARTPWTARDLEALTALGGDVGFAGSCGEIVERLRKLEVHLRPKPGLYGDEINPDDWAQYQADLKAAKDEVDRVSGELAAAHPVRRHVETARSPTPKPGR